VFVDTKKNISVAAEMAKLKEIVHLYKELENDISVSICLIYKTKIK